MGFKKVDILRQLVDPANPKFNFQTQMYLCFSPSIQEATEAGRRNDQMTKFIKAFSEERKATEPAKTVYVQFCGKLAERSQLLSLNQIHQNKIKNNTRYWANRSSVHIHIV